MGVSGAGRGAGPEPQRQAARRGRGGRPDWLSAGPGRVSARRPAGGLSPTFPALVHQRPPSPGQGLPREAAGWLWQARPRPRDSAPGGGGVGAGWLAGCPGTWAKPGSREVDRKQSPAGTAGLGPGGPTAEAGGTRGAGPAPRAVWAGTQTWSRTDAEYPQPRDPANPSHGAGLPDELSLLHFTTQVVWRLSPLV